LLKKGDFFVDVFNVFELNVCARRICRLMSDS
jgi:hypothetical protein